MDFLSLGNPTKLQAIDGDHDTDVDHSFSDVFTLSCKFVFYWAEATIMKM